MYPRRDGLKILVIEDERIYSRMALEVLEGCDRHVAATGEQGFDMYKNLEPDIVFLDIGLPDRSGLTVLREIKGENPEAFVVMFTSSALSEDVDAARLRGAAGYIAKPFNRGALLKYLNVYHEFYEKMQSLTEKERRELYAEFFEKAHTLNEEQPVVALDDYEEKMRSNILENWPILYADPNIQHCEQVKKQLRQRGYHVDASSSVKALWQDLERQSYGMCFLDNHFAQADGSAALARQIRHKYPDLVIAMILDGAWEKEDKQWNILDIKRFLVRPLKAKILLRVIEDELQRHIRDMHEIYIE